ncbi:hypothetical protein [Plasmodium yoelii yoelii]|uniref:Uncharacterized protein n=1 Tax=Plasmodium yoelii yoelii TaxID=73239 RepID=Q7RJG1_PLAYO|nr:hypothetical protein [Plasmodium yoelii yoelii]
MDIFNCHYCSISPFDYILELIYGEKPNKNDEKKSSVVTYDDSSSNNVSQIVSKVGDAIEKRSTNEVLLLCRAWENYVHPRAKEYWKDSQQLQNILCKIANGITKNDDPILGDDYACVFWFGDKNKNDNCPIISVKKGNDNIETITYVNRVLIFLYAGLAQTKKINICMHTSILHHMCVCAYEASFQELQKKPKKAFTMACGNINCINLTHISLDD